MGKGAKKKTTGKTEHKALAVGVWLTREGKSDALQVDKGMHVHMNNPKNNLHSTQHIHPRTCEQRHHCGSHSRQDG